MLLLLPFTVGAGSFYSIEMGIFICELNVRMFFQLELQIELRLHSPFSFIWAYRDANWFRFHSFVHSSFKWAAWEEMLQHVERQRTVRRQKHEKVRRRSRWRYREIVKKKAEGKKLVKLQINILWARAQSRVSQAVNVAVAVAVLCCKYI